MDISSIYKNLIRCLEKFLSALDPSPQKRDRYSPSVLDSDTIIQVKTAYDNAQFFQMFVVGILLFDEMSLYQIHLNAV